MILHIPHDIYLFGCQRDYSEERAIDMENFFHVLSSHLADSLREINEAERPGWMRAQVNERAA